MAVVAGPSSCTIIVDDGFIGVVHSETSCPSQLGVAIYVTDWGHLMP